MNRARAILTTLTATAVLTAGLLAATAGTAAASARPGGTCTNVGATMSWRSETYRCEKHAGDPCAYWRWVYRKGAGGKPSRKEPCNCTPTPAPSDPTPTQPAPAPVPAQPTPPVVATPGTPVSHPAPPATGPARHRAGSVSTGQRHHSGPTAVDGSVWRQRGRWIRGEDTPTVVEVAAPVCGAAATRTVLLAASTSTRAVPLVWWLALAAVALLAAVAIAVGVLVLRRRAR